jgi:hypothetical protein
MNRTHGELLGDESKITLNQWNVNQYYQKSFILIIRTIKQMQSLPGLQGRILKTISGDTSRSRKESRHEQAAHSQTESHDGAVILKGIKHGQGKAREAQGSGSSCQGGPPPNRD